MPGIESNAIEPTKDELKGPSTGARLIRLAPTYGLVILMGILLVTFSLLLPNTFPTLLNLRAIRSDKAIIEALSLAAMAAGRIDLTAGCGIVQWHILVSSLQTVYGVPWPIAVLIVLAQGVVVGFLIEVARIDSFIATLGTGTILYAVAPWQTGAGRWWARCPMAFWPCRGHSFSACPSPPIMWW